MLNDYISYTFVPRFYYRQRFLHLIKNLSDREKNMISDRVAYYNKLTRHTSIDGGITVGKFHFPLKRKDLGIKKSRLSTYFFDQYEVMRYFPSNCKFLYIPGDITDVPRQPSFVKSRPISGDNSNAILLKLNKRRHFKFVDDHLTFREKKDKLVWRATWCNVRPWRREFCEKFLHNPLCDIGKVQAELNEDFPESIKGYMSRDEQLQFKFIACIEGIDVATNLKWVMSSNSVAVSPPMRYETWYMEGRLVPGYHYIEVKSDFSNLEEKIQYYTVHPQEAEEIIKHAHEWVKQFQNERLELATQILVAQKYFEHTNNLYDDH